jgi:hypothetical protein
MSIQSWERLKDRSKSASMASADILENIAQELPMAERELVFPVQGQSYEPLFDEELTVTQAVK